MKKTVSILGGILFTLVILLPSGVVFSSYFGYTFELASYSVFAILTALLSVCTVIFCVTVKESDENNIVKVLFSLLTPLSLINAIFYMFESSRNGVVIASVFICVICCCYLTIEHGKPLILKIISLGVSTLMSWPIILWCFIALIFGSIVQNTVIQSAESPNRAYYAEVIYSNQGALGDDIFINVYENKGIDIFIFKILKKPQSFYESDLGEFGNIEEIYWKDDNCLVINSAEYKIE